MVTLKRTLLTLVFLSARSFSVSPTFDKSPANRPSNLKAYQPTAPEKESSTDPHVIDLLREVDGEKLFSAVVHLASIQNRSSHAAGIQEATQYVKSQLKALGYTPSLQCFDRSAYGPICNVVAVKSAVNKTPKNVVVVAHMDSVGKPQAGADDNATGTAGLIEIARILRDRPTETNVVFLAVNAEEDGLIGSTHYVNDLSRKGTLKNIELAVVMDMEGYNVRNQADIETYEAHRTLGQSFINEIPAYTGLPARLIIPGWGSDHVPFLEKGVPSFLVITDTDVNTPCYHKACDKPDTLDVPYFKKMIQVSLLATARAAKVRF